MFLFLGKFPDPGGLKLLSDPASLLLIVDVSVLDSNVLTIDVLPKTTQILILYDTYHEYRMVIQCIS